MQCLSNTFCSAYTRSSTRFVLSSCLIRFYASLPPFLEFHRRCVANTAARVSTVRGVHNPRVLAFTSARTSSAHQRLTPLSRHRNPLTVPSLGLRAGRTSLVLYIATASARFSYFASPFMSQTPGTPHSLKCSSPAIPLYETTRDILHFLGPRDASFSCCCISLDSSPPLLSPLFPGT